MEGIISLLPDSIANQIAAGEVVQRPASVVKELLENSIDAGATQVQLIIKDAGKTLIQVIDNGKGMSELDARMCFERHATSKLKTSEDLFNILTFGFRGEAMASIAAVAQVELKTKRVDDELGITICIEGSEIKKQEPLVTAGGTNILVKNLFFNVPARRNFLKSNPVEMRHIIDEFQRVALAYPEISFSLLQNDIEVFNLVGSKLSQRIVNLFGKGYQTQLIPVEEKTDFVEVHGYIGKPEMSKKTRGEQFFFANNRFIKHPYLNHAVNEAYGGMLVEKTHPFYCLFITIDPKHIDINVHPTKTEIKFDDERTVYAIIHAAIKKSLGINNIAPSIDFEQNVNLGVSTAGKRDYGDEKPPFEVPGFLQKTPREESNQDNWSTLYEGHETTTVGSAMNKPISREGMDEGLHFPSALNQDESGDQQTIVSSAMNTAPVAQEHVETFQINAEYIVAKVKSGLLLVDQQAAHERILFEKYMYVQHNSSGASQQCLFPQTIELNAADFVLVKELQEEIQTLGFSFDEFGKDTLIIRGVPSDVKSGEEKEVFELLIEQYKYFVGELKIDKNEALARSLAKRTSIKKGKVLSTIEANAIIEQLFLCDNPNYSTEGSSTFVILDAQSINKLF